MYRLFNLIATLQSCAVLDLCCVLSQIVLVVLLGLNQKGTSKLHSGIQYNLSRSYDYYYYVE